MIYLSPSKTWEVRLDSAQPKMYSLRRDGVNLRITEIDFKEWFEVVDDENKA